MKRPLSIVLLLAAGFVFAGCSGTNDRGVITDRPFNIFGAAATPNSGNPSTPVIAPASVPPATNV